MEFIPIISLGTVLNFRFKKPHRALQNKKMSSFSSIEKRPNEVN